MDSYVPYIYTGTINKHVMWNMAVLMQETLVTGKNI